MAQKVKATGTSTATKLYLSLYNGVNAFGWGFVLFLMGKHFSNGGTPEQLYPVVEQALKLVQTLACMEIVHAAVGLVRASAVTTFIQVFSRIFVLWGITHVAPPAQTSHAFALMCASWSAVEVPRYTYLTANLWGAVPYPLLWLRYSLFAVLYPTGITGEMWSIVSALDYVKAHGVFSIALPNAYNLLFNYHGFLWFTLTVIYPFGGYYMYSHMVRQRAKKLAPKAKSE